MIESLGDSKMSFEIERLTAVEAVLLACKLTKNVQSQHLSNSVIQKEDKRWGKVTNAPSAEKSGKEHMVKPARERKKRKNLKSEYLNDFL